MAISGSVGETVSKDLSKDLEVEATYIVLQNLAPLTTSPGLLFENTGNIAREPGGSTWPRSSVSNRAGQCEWASWRRSHRSQAWAWGVGRLSCRRTVSRYNRREAGYSCLWVEKIRNRRDYSMVEGSWGAMGNELGYLMPPAWAKIGPGEFFSHCGLDSLQKKITCLQIVISY